MSQSVNKITAERNQKALLDLLALPGNDICADCKSRNPRWASHNLGIFICVHCASIHRKIGTHITKVKSVTLDSWTKEQVETMKQMGNIKSNAVYNPDESRHPPPPNMIDSERDSDLEKFIRAKYEFKSFFSRSALVASYLGPSRSASQRLAAEANKSQPKSADTVARPVAASTADNGRSSHTASSLASSTSLPPASFTSQSPVVSTPTHTSVAANAANPTPRSVSQPYTSVAQHQQQVQQPSQTSNHPPAQSSHPVWNDLVSLQGPSSNASLPLQVASAPVTTQNFMPSQLSQTNSYGSLSASPSSYFSSNVNPANGITAGGAARSVSLNTGLSSQAATGLSSNFFAPSVYSQQQYTPAATPMFTSSNTPSPNPFVSQSLPATTGSAGFGIGGTMGGGMPAQLQMPFGTPSFQNQQPQHQLQQQYLLQQQQPQQAMYQQSLQAPSAVNSFMQPSQPQPPTTPFSAPPHFVSTPSPYAASQPLPSQMQAPYQQQQQPQQQQFGAGNPFTSWMQHSQPGDQWGGR